MAKRGPYKKVGKAILYTIAAAGIVSMAVLAPNTLQILGRWYKPRGKHGERRLDTKYYLDVAVHRLKRRGLIAFHDRNGETVAELTDKGQKQLLKYQLKDLVIQKPGRWDKKWRIIIFDIAERRRRVRDELRFELEQLGFEKLQQSVWVFPYECREVVTLLKAHFLAGDEILYMVVEHIENDRRLRERFRV